MPLAVCGPLANSLRTRRFGLAVHTTGRMIASKRPARGVAGTRRELLISRDGAVLYFDSEISSVVKVTHDGDVVTLG